MIVNVLFVDDDEDLCLVMAELLSLLGHECVSVGSLDALISQRARALASTVALVDINLGPGAPSGLDVYRWLRTQGFTGGIVFVTGHGHSHPLVGEVCQLGDAKVVEKPIDLEQLCSLLDEATPP